MPIFARRLAALIDSPQMPHIHCKIIAMPDTYPVSTVKAEWILGREEMGSKDKFWYRNPEDDAAVWLFKYPQSSTGQHWAEKIVSQTASQLSIMHAEVELAEFRGRRGSVTKSFATGGRELIHGNQLLAYTVNQYDPKGKFGQFSHTLANIRHTMDLVFLERESAREAKRIIAEYLVLDALVGNTDRHHENWGILWKRTGSRWEVSVAPSFDHASSLGRELSDERRDRQLAENRVGRYAEKGRGAIYWSADGQRAPSPLDLVRKAAGKHPEPFRRAISKLDGIGESDFRRIIERVPAAWMTASARTFAFNLLCYTRRQLQEIVR